MMPGAKLTHLRRHLSADNAFLHRPPVTASHLGTTATTPSFPAAPHYGINGSHGGGFCVVGGGGVPVRSPRGEVLGAVGCSMGTPAQDEVVARAGVELVERMIREEEEEAAEGGKGGVLKAKL